MTASVTQRYATALVELAEDNKAVKKVEKDLVELAAMIADSADLRSVIQLPSLGLKQQETAMMAVADKAKLQDITKNFVGVLVRNRRLSLLPRVIEAVQAELSARRGEVVAKVQTAEKLSAKQSKALKENLGKAIGHTVQIEASVKPEILGGMIVTIGSQMIDDSVARKIERLSSAMGAQANQNASNDDQVASKESKSKTTSKKKEA